mmetsp:Transcript_24776/g.39938  ORF Transcript_24776/g.39938 Transcript_24776/m.39938 type:complete len:81 (-) Transcript_24776:82-324(-)|eukprot:CAMPEP_0179433920 /NCGR_PEP_ID=MMETSP0799-20121207/18250_1 /TAXON_ID=46947 /ORGANISM="Geminigera cryophila, Strain CCMP2564" /LENGTH=80 /DNA_ID=CAMNT_0021212213 /DNA_START=104 /DNA_END=346 /DNA_ORIENTATION=-
MCVLGFNSSRDHDPASKLTSNNTVCLLACTAGCCATLAHLRQLQNLAHLGFNGLGGEVATTPDALEWNLAGQAARGIAVV